MAITVGPVVGQVTPSTARILVETRHHIPRLCCTLTPSRRWVSEAAESSSLSNNRLDVPKKSQTKAFRAGHPAVFVFSGLSPDCIYVATFEIRSAVKGKVPSFRRMVTTGAVTNKGNSKLEQYACFRTPSEDPARPVRLAAMSCDCVNVRGRGAGLIRNMWEKFWAESVAKGLVDVVIHHGDQVYADCAFDQGLVLHEAQAALSPGKKKMSRADIDNTILEGYKEIYRKTWRQNHTRKVLAHASHLMISDDHEFRNDMGAFPEDKEEGSVAREICQVARMAYWLYQKQLMTDIDADAQRLGFSTETGLYTGADPAGGQAGAGVDEESMQPDWSYHALGHLGLVFMDNRMCRSLATTADNDCYYGRRQLEAMRKELEDGELSQEQVTNLVVVCPSPAVFVSTEEAARLKRNRRIVDKLASAIYPEDQAHFLNNIKGWQAAVNGRGTLLIGGDMHFGVKTEIFDGSGFSCAQIISSAMSSRPPCWDSFGKWKASAGCDGEPRAIAGGFQYRHVEWHYAWNYALITSKARGPAAGQGEEQPQPQRREEEATSAWRCPPCLEVDWVKYDIVYKGEKRRRTSSEQPRSNAAGAPPLLVAIGSVAFDETLVDTEDEDEGSADPFGWLLRTQSAPATAAAIQSRKRSSLEAFSVPVDLFPAESSHEPTGCDLECTCVESNLYDLPEEDEALGGGGGGADGGGGGGVGCRGCARGGEGAGAASVAQ